MHCHHFHHQQIDLMSSVRSICDNFESMSDNNKKYVLSCGDSHYDKKKTKFILFFIIKKGPELGENLQLYKKKT